jgi:hypothetical protein
MGVTGARQCLRYSTNDGSLFLILDRLHSLQHMSSGQLRAAFLIDRRLPHVCGQREDMPDGKNPRAMA